MREGESDEELLERYAQGEADAFELFFSRHKFRVYHYALRKVHQSELAAEIVQEVFLRLHSRIHQYRSGERALAWFFAIVHNVCVDELRRMSVSFRAAQHLESLEKLNSEIENGLGPDSPVDERAEESGFIGKSLARLSDDQRMVVEQRVLGEKTFRQISLETGKNEVALRKIYSRAIGLLRGWFGSHDGGDGR